jgi:hypothetical protein
MSTESGVFRRGEPLVTVPAQRAERFFPLNTGIGEVTLHVKGCDGNYYRVRYRINPMRGHVDCRIPWYIFQDGRRTWGDYF